jgi:hypothetical protein
MNYQKILCLNKINENMYIRFKLINLLLNCKSRSTFMDKKKIKNNLKLYENIYF